MRIKDLISELETLYNSYDDQDREVMGEPTISIDLFRHTYPGSPNYSSQYAGISNEIIIEPHPHNWYCPVIVSFAEAYEEKYSHLYRDSKGKAHSDRTAAWPESWET